MIVSRPFAALLSASMAVAVLAEDLNPRAPAPTPAETLNPLSLGALAASLYSEYYPSTTITNLADLTFPPTIVIGSQTLVIHSGTISTPKATSASATKSSNSATASQTNSGSETAGASSGSDNTPSSTTNSDSSSGTNTASNANDNSATGASATNSASDTNGNSATGAPSSSQSTTGTNKSTHHGLSAGAIAGIVVGTILGVALFALLLFCCLKRREKRSRKHHTKSTVHDKEPGRLHDPVPHDIPPPHAFHDGIGGNPNRRSAERNGRVPEMAALSNAGHHPHQRMSGQNPFYSDEERANARHNGIAPGQHDRMHPNGLHSNGMHPGGMHSPNGMHQHNGMVPTAAALAVASHHRPRHSSGSHGQIPRRAVPNRSSVPPANGLVPPQAYNAYRPSERSGMQDGFPPVVPTRSAERRDSPKLHYPTRDEVSQFDFNGRGSGQSSNPSIPQSCQCNECRPTTHHGTNQNTTVLYQFD